MINYYPESDNGGGGDPKKSPPKGYKPLSSIQRRDWNDFLDYLQKEGVAGSKELDQADKNIGKSYIEKYRKENPNTSVSEDLIPSVQYEQQAFRTGDSFPGMSSEQLRVLRKQINPDYLKRQTADPGTPFNATLSREYYPQFKKGDKNYGTDMEGYLKDFSKVTDKNEGNGNEKDPHILYLPPDTKKPLRIKDTRKIDSLTGHPIGSKNDFSKDIDSDTAANIIKQAKLQGVDPLTALAISYQETGINKEHPFDLNPDQYGTNYGDPAKGVKSIVDKMKYAKQIQEKGIVPKGEDYLIQGYNGYGKIKKGHADLEGSTSIYGMPIPDEGLDFKKSPLYGKRILDIRDNILKNNPDIIKMLQSEEKSQPEKKTLGTGPPDIGISSDDYNKENDPKREGDTNPLPDYNDSASRANYLKEWAKKYGDLEGGGDTVLKVNEVPRGGSDTMKNISIKAAKEYGIDPALLYSSAMKEGASALFKDKSGLDTRHKKPGEFGYQAFYGDKEFPINGNESMGVPDFANRFPELVAGGYLSKDFSSRFRGKKNAGQYSENDFKTVEDGMKAKAALMKFGKDYVDKYAAKNGIELSKNAEDFFSLVFFNGGEGGVQKLLKRYNEEGLLKDDKFLKEHPHKNEKIDPKDDIWAHVAPRLRMASALKQEKHFEE